MKGGNELSLAIQVNLDMTDSMEPEKLVRHMQNPSYTYDEYVVCIGLGPSISSVICENLSHSGPPGSPVLKTTFLSEEVLYRQIVAKKILLLAV